MMEWISVECENPKEYNSYFATWEDKQCGPFIGICEYDEDEGWLVDGMYQSKWYHNIKITAWMDAKPYKED